MRPGRTALLAEKPPGQDTEFEVPDPVALSGVARAALEKIGEILGRVEAGALDEAEAVREIEEI